MTEHPPIGIDLGTTHSVVAVFEPAGPRVLATSEGETLIPSQVALDDADHVLVGLAAQAIRLRRPERGVARFKPDMGRERALSLGPVELSPVSASALVLRELKAVAEGALGRPVERAVISVPAWFGEPQRRATLDAGRLAGLEVSRLINEPTAAALAHGLHDAAALKRVAVLDLGGGTFDVTVLELFDGVGDVRASVGDVHLGGEDVTDAVLRWMLLRSRGGALSATTEVRLRQRAEAAKRALSTSDAVDVELESGGARLERAELEALCAPLAERMNTLVRQAIVQSGLRAEDIDEVVLAGGAVRMPFVAALAERCFGRAPAPLGAVDHLIALGAAVQAGLVAGHEALRERLMTDVLTHSLGVAAVSLWGDRAYDDRFSVVLGRGTALPASRVEEYHPVRHDQTRVVIQVYEGERRIASENHLLGTIDVPVPPRTNPEEREALSVRFTHDASGLLEVEVQVRSTGELRQVLLERGGLSSDDASRAAFAEQMAPLKTHPRELLPNRWWLERGTTVVELTSGAQRRELDTLLLAFEAALDGGEPDRIDAARASLSARVRELEHALGLNVPS